ncbi:MAG TPA: hypothetical protein VJZ00_12470, partial [Thermoanaerobaculia bacterium]|nr:hypothetical protein [Thermoanaerobaculia bacterium]
SGQAPAKKLDTVPRTAGHKVYLIDKPDAPQSVIVATHVSEPGGVAEDLAIRDGDAQLRRHRDVATQSQSPPRQGIGAMARRAR